MAGSVVGENWLGVCGSLLATFSPFLHVRKFHGGQSPLGAQAAGPEPTLSPGGRARRKYLEGP